MVEYCLKNSAELYIQQLIGTHLYYGIKSPGMDLYDFGFRVRTGLNYNKPEQLSYILHVTCEFKVIWKEKGTNYYDINTPTDRFATDVQKLIGLQVKRATLSNKNDLWIDLGKCWIVFVTFETDEESWRFFTSSREGAHLVASNSWLQRVF